MIGAMMTITDAISRIATAWATWALTVMLAGQAAVAAREGEDDWPQFHGPRRDNRSTETGLLPSWPADGPHLLWRSAGIGHGFGTVSIAGDRIFVAGDVQGRTVISALDLSGRIVWQADNGPIWTGAQPGSRGTPTIDGERLYHFSAVGSLVCLDAGSGQRIWSRNILDEFASQNITWALAESVLIDRAHVICSPGGPRTAVVALDKLTGRTVWESPSAGDLAGYGSVSLGEFGGRRQFFTLTSAAVIAVDADTGALLWRVEQETPWEENILKPIYHDGHVFVSSQKTGSILLRLAADGDGISAEPVWRNTDLDNHHGGVVLVDGYLYGSGRFNGNRWACLEWRTGRTMYLDRGVGKGSLTYADGFLYTRGENGLMGLVPATPTEHRIVSQFQPPGEAEGPAWAHPVICRGRLYLRHSDLLDCYDIRSPERR
jgi:outer membrane protein assembly factor BamB